MPEPVQPSPNTPPPSRKPMQLVSEVQDQPTLSSLISQNPTIPTTTTKPVSRETEYVHRAAWKAGVMGSLNVLFAVLAVRTILLFAVVGAFVLTWTVVKAPDPITTPSLIILAVYGLLVVLPVVWLSSRR